MAKLKPGTQLRSAVCETKVMVIAAPDADVEVTCGGAPLIAVGESASGGAPSADAAGGTQLGKRYVNEGGDLELLCVHAGEGSLAVAGTTLTIKGAKPLPSSD